MFFASVLLGQPHGPSLLSMLLIGSPFNAAFYGVAFYFFLKANRI
jgi:hypothetical protein